MIDPKQQLKEELIDRGKLQGFENIISAIVDKILLPATPNCKLACFDCSKSKITQEEGKDSLIQIGIKDRKSEPITVIWDILHEYGHHLSGAPKVGVDLRLKREELAWEKAYEELQNYPELQNQKESFNDYKEVCLKDYRANPDLVVSH